jgi:hypothetical protein
MRKAITVILFSFLTLGLWAQTKSEVKKMPMASVPIKEDTQLIYYSTTFSSEFSDSALYKRAAHWYITENKSMRLQNENCVLNQKITGRAEYNLLGIKEGKEQPLEGRLKFTVITEIKNGKVTVEITRFNVADAKYTPIEPWIKLQETDLKYKYSFIFIEAYAKKLLESFVASVNVQKKQ